MTTGSNFAVEPTGKEIVITREFDAPRELVWKVWTQPEHITQWWGPRGFTTTVTEMDLRPGGRSRYVMHGPDGNEYPVCGVFREVVPLKRIVTTDEFDEGYQHPDGMDLPTGIILTAEFESVGRKTRLTLTISHPTVEDRKKHEAMGVIGGWSSSFDCMDDYLAALADEVQLRQLITDQMSAIRAKDMDRLMSFYVADAVIFDVKPPLQINGADAFRRTWEACLPYFPDTFQTEVRDLSLTVSGELAMARWLARFTGMSHPVPWMRFTACYRKIRDRWQIVHEHVSVPFHPETGQAALALEPDASK